LVLPQPDGPVRRILDVGDLSDCGVLLTMLCRIELKCESSEVERRREAVSWDTKEVEEREAWRALGERREGGGKRSERR